MSSQREGLRCKEMGEGWKVVVGGGVQDGRKKIDIRPDRAGKGVEISLNKGPDPKHNLSLFSRYAP